MRYLDASLFDFLVYSVSSPTGDSNSSSPALLPPTVTN